MAVQIALDEEGTLGGLNMYSTLSDDIDEHAGCRKLAHMPMSVAGY
jgi:hypothetical protein